MNNGGLSTARLGRMHDVMSGYAERGEVPGLVTLVSRRGEVHVDAIGMKAVEGLEPMRRNTIFRVSSMTKPITAAATMILVEECKLRLDGPVDRLLSELANRKVLKRLDGPLDDTVPAAKLDRLATGYWTNFETGALELYDEARGGQWSRPPAFPSGAGGLVSTTDDYLAFGQMMLNRGKHGNERLLSRPSVETMTTDQLTPEQKAASGLVPGYFDKHGWGFGVSIVTRRDDVAAVPGRFGWDGGLGTSWYSDPKEDMVTILMTQRAWTSPSPPDVCLDFWTSAYQAIDD